jgi:hypothetical protein
MSAPGRVTEWFFGSVPVHVMVVNRVILGAVLFLHALSRVPEFGALYGATGGAWTAAHRDFVSSFLARDLSPPLLAAVSGLAALPPEARQIALVALYAGLLASSLAFALGLFTRTAGLVAVLLHLLFVAVHPFAFYGWGSMIAPFAIYVALSRAGDFASLDALRRRSKGEPEPDEMVPAWPMRLLQVHVAAMYFHSGFARIDDPDWLQGEVLFEALTRALFTRFSFDLFFWKPALLMLSYAVFLLEPAAALLLWVPRVRTLCALALLAMHVILELLTNVGWWNFIMIGGLLAFLPPPWIARLVPRLVPKRERRPAFAG